MARFTLTVKITCHKANPFSWKTIIVYKLHRHRYLLWVFISVNGTFGRTPEIEVLCHTRPFLYIFLSFHWGASLRFNWLRARSSWIIFFVTSKKWAPGKNPSFVHWRPSLQYISWFSSDIQWVKIGDWFEPANLWRFNPQLCWTWGILTFVEPSFSHPKTWFIH